MSSLFSPFSFFLSFSPSSQNRLKPILLKNKKKEKERNKKKEKETKQKERKETKQKKNKKETFKFNPTNKGNQKQERESNIEINIFNTIRIVKKVSFFIIIIKNCFNKLLHFPLFSESSP